MHTVHGTSTLKADYPIQSQLPEISGDIVVAAGSGKTATIHAITK